MPEPTLTQRTERFDLNALYETSRLLSSSLDLEFVLNNLLLTAMSKLLIMRGAVLLYDPVESAYRVASSKGVTGLKPGDRFRINPSSCQSLTRGTDVPSELAAHRITLVLPVRFGHREIGLIALGGKATGAAFDRAELEFIQSLVNMSSAAVHNSLMVEELRQANRDLDGKIQQLNTLFDLSQEFNATLDRKQVLKLLSFALMGQMTVGKYLFLQRVPDNGEHAGDGQQSELRVVAARGITEASLDTDTVGSLCSNRELVTLQHGDPVPPEWESLHSIGITVVIPLQQQGGTCAVLCLGPKMTGMPYQADDIEFLYALGNLTFVSLQNAYLVEELIDKGRLEEEIRLAREIQIKLLPQEIPTFPGIDIAGLAVPSRDVGGDFFDVAPLEGSRFLMAIGDVTGKGVPAALLMANLQACLHVLFPMPMSLEDATANINRVICENTSYDKFITYFHGIYHPESHALDYVNAGHNPPFVLRAGGEVERLETGGLLLGVMKNLTYERGRIVLAPGDLLVLFTDGVSEAMNEDGTEEFGEERLIEILQQHRGDSSSIVLNAIYNAIRRFSGDAPLSDDVTVVVMRVLD